MKPAIFNTEMVIAILDGRKTQTRRACKVQPRHNDVYADQYNHNSMQYAYWALDNRLHDYLEKTPYKVGDIIYVRETWGLTHEYNLKSGNVEILSTRVVYRSDNVSFPDDGKWKPSIHMPKEYARLFLRVKDVRIERLNEISEEDAIREGIERKDDFFNCPLYKCYTKGQEDISFPHDPIGSFCSLWESIYGNGSFDNRWVWVIEFELISKEEAMKC